MRYPRVLYAALLLGACSGGSGAGSNGSNADGGGPFGNSTAHAAGGSGVRSGSSAGGSDARESCSTPGATRECCDGGIQTCEGMFEFASWGPCVDHGGKTLTCEIKQPCGAGEFGPGCDAGMDSGIACRPGERGCDAGTPPPPKLCDDDEVNNEPEILAGFSPASGESVGKDGQIKLWITDEHAAFIAPGEQVDAMTGMITKPGDRAAKASDGYLLEPALYIAPESADNGGTPHFPQLIKGPYNNDPIGSGKRFVVQGAPIDPAPSSINLSEKYDSEDVWDVSELGLAPGTYIGEFMIHDGDEDRGVGCVTIVITP